MRMRIFALALVILSNLGCTKEKTKYSYQYEVLRMAGNQSSYSIIYLDPSGATVSTGVIDTFLWDSPVYSEVEEGEKVRLEVKVEQGLPRLDLIIKKNNSVVSKKEVRSAQSEYVLEDEL